MLDYRTKTFLTLCDEMNYRKTAKKLNMTQPGVTQHIQLLEREYDCSLFSYNRKKLVLTRQGELLREHLLRIQYDESWLRVKLNETKVPTLRIGATKSIGDYMIARQLITLLHSGEYTVDLSVDNTQNLLESLKNGTIDFAMIEGEFDKTIWGFQKMWAEPYVGICSVKHPFSGQNISVKQLFTEHLLLREIGSGTRAIFEKELNRQGYNMDSFKKINNISSFYVLRELIAEGSYISFGYQSIMREDNRLASFTVEGFPKSHNLYYVYQKNTHAEELLEKYFEILERN